MSVVLDGGGKGSLADHRIIREGRGEKAMIIAGKQGWRGCEEEGERNRQRGMQAGL